MGFLYTLVMSWPSGSLKIAVSNSPSFIVTLITRERRVKDAIHIRLHPNNINRVSGIEIPEAWMPTIKKHNNRRAVRLRTAEGANHS